MCFFLTSACLENVNIARLTRETGTFNTPKLFAPNASFMTRSTYSLEFFYFLVFSHPAIHNLFSSSTLNLSQSNVATEGETYFNLVLKIRVVLVPLLDSWLRYHRLRKQILQTKLLEDRL